MNVGDFLEMVMPSVGELCPQGCGDWQDHLCTTGSAAGHGRCLTHCTCQGEPVGYQVNLTVTLPTQAAADEITRQLREVTRGRAAPGTPAAHLSVTQTPLGA